MGWWNVSAAWQVVNRMPRAPAPAAAADAVTEWSLLADSVAHGSANWHTLAIMHQAMHDARNAAEPVYARWFPLTSDEPADTGADPDAAMAAAAQREFPGLTEMARERSDSRIWAGAHFRTANEESERVAARISAQALAAVPAR